MNQNTNKRTNQQAKKNKPFFFNFGIASPKFPPIKEIDFVEEIIERRLERNSTIEYIGLGGVGTRANEWLDNFTAATQKSPTYEAARKAKIEYAFKDLSYNKGKENEATNFENVSPRGLSLFEVAKNAANQFEIYGNAFLELIKIGDKIFIDTLNIYQCRPVKNLALGYADKIAISALFENLEFVPANPTKDDKDVQIVPLYPNFAPFETAGGTVEKSIIHIKNDAPAFNYWGLPAWLAAYDYMLLQYQMARYNRSEFENGFRPTGFFRVNQDVSDAELKEFKKDIKEASGVANNGRTFVTSDGIEFISTQTKMDGHYTSLDEITTNKILETCNMPPALAGIKTAGSLGSSQQLQNEFEAFQNVAVKPLQRIIYDRIIKPYQLQLGYTLANLPIAGIIGSSPVTLRSQINPATILTINEQRELMGFPKLTTAEADLLPNQQNSVIQ